MNRKTSPPCKKNAATPGRLVAVRDKMQKNYRYRLNAPVGRAFASDFRPQLSPMEMLQMGVFGGNYMRDCGDEFPKTWFSRARLATGENAEPSLNFFEVAASQPLSVWRAKGWINERHDPRGWFQWYCRYYRGRRLPDEDARQIKRWRMMARHIAQIKSHCPPGDLTCRRRQRQALLHWAYDSRKF